MHQFFLIVIATFLLRGSAHETRITSTTRATTTPPVIQSTTPRAPTSRDAYDFVLIGAGSAVRLLGMRLNEKYNKSVLVLQLDEEKPSTVKHPAQQDFRVVSNARIKKITFDKNARHVLAVTYTTNNGHPLTVRIKEELILSSGSKSVAILRRSIEGKDKNLCEYEKRGTGKNTNKTEADRAHKESLYFRTNKEAAEYVKQPTKEQKVETTKPPSSTTRRPSSTTTRPPPAAKANSQAIAQHYHASKIINLNLLLLNPQLNIQFPAKHPTTTKRPVICMYAQQLLQGSLLSKRSADIRRALQLLESRKGGNLKEPEVEDCSRFKNDVEQSLLCYLRRHMQAKNKEKKAEQQRKPCVDSKERDDIDLRSLDEVARRLIG